MDERPFAGPGDAELDYDRDLGYPGQFPFTRGIQPRRCTAAATGRSASTPASAPPRRPTSGSGSCSSQGQPGLSTAFDLPTQMGLDSDDDRGRRARSARSASRSTRSRDMEAVFDGIPLDKVSTSMTINAPAPVLVAMYVAVGDKQGAIRADRSRGTAQNDVLKEYVARGTYIYPPKPSLRLAADLIAWCAHRRRRGSMRSRSPATTCARPAPRPCRRWRFTFANAIAYIEAVRDRGVDVDAFAPRLSWIFNTHMNFFEEIAKYRALRRLWAHDHEGALRREGPALDDAAHPHPDRRLDADAPAAREQHRPGGDPGAGRGAGRRAVDGALAASTRRSRSRPRRRRRSPCARSRSSPRRSASPTRSTRWRARTTSSG